MLRRYLSVGVVAIGLAHATPVCASAAPPAGAVAVHDAEQVGLAPYAEVLASSGRPPLDYLVEALGRHDVVLLGEEHGVREHVEFIAGSLGPLYHRAGLRRLGTEFVCARNQERLEQLVLGDTFDRELAIAIQRDYAWPTWGFAEYLGVLEAAWRVNASLPADAPRLRVVALDSDWSQHDLFMGRMSPLERFESVRERERRLIETVERELVAPGRKSLVHIGFAHTPRGDGERMGMVLHRRYGDRIGQIAFHQGFATPGGGAAARLVELASARAGADGIGFDVVGTPFEKLYDPASPVYSFGKGRTLGELAAGYLMLKPLGELRPVRWIDGFIDAEQFPEALDVAVAQGQADRDRDNTPEKLDARLKGVIESRRFGRR